MDRKLAFFLGLLLVCISAFRIADSRATPPVGESKPAIQAWEWREYLKSCTGVLSHQDAHELPTDNIMGCFKLGEVWGKLSAKERADGQERLVPVLVRIKRWEQAWRHQHADLADGFEYIFLKFVEKDSKLRVAVRAKL